MSINPSIDIKNDITITSISSGASVSGVLFDDDNYDRVTPLTLTLGYDHSYDNGLVLGVHAMRTAASQLNIDGDDTIIDDFYLQSISFGIGYEWK